MTISTSATPATPCPAYNRMASRWDLPTALMGGTAAMRSAGERYLPKEEKESPSAYQCRIDRSILYEGYADTIFKLAAKPFGEPLKIEGGDLPKPLSKLIDNADREGGSLQTIANRVMLEAMTYGMCHVMVDYPRVTAPAGRERTLADDEAEDIRPFLRVISPVDLISWSSKLDPTNGESRIVTEVRYKTVRITTGENRWEVKEVEQIKHWTSTDCITYEFNPSTKEWVVYDSVPHTFGQVPIFTYYTRRIGFMEALPPLEGLAWLNLAHWQSQSDHRNILRFIRLGILFAAGFTQEEVEKGVVIGPNKLVSSTNEKATLSYVETQGRAVDAGKADLDRLEEQMEVLGLQPLIERSSEKTATGHVLDDARSSSAMKSWVVALERGLREILRLAFKWIGEEMPETLKVSLNANSTIQLAGSTDVQSLLQSCEKKFISVRTFLLELQRRNIISELVDVEAEAKLADEQVKEAQKKEREAMQEMAKNKFPPADSKGPPG